MILEPSKLLSRRWPQYLAGFSAASGAISLGTACGWSAPAGPRFSSEYFPITSSEMSWVSAIVNLGCAFSCLPIGYFLKLFGRKRTMVFLVIPMVIGWLLVTLAQNFATLFAGRVLIGMAGGAFCVAAPQYSAEIAEKEIRGALGCFLQLLTIAGILFVYVIGPFMPILWMNIICTLLPFLFGTLLCFMPESPVYLLTENREDEAVKALKWLRGSTYETAREVEDLKKSLCETNDNKVTLKDVFARRSSIWAIIITVGLVIFRHVCGVNSVVFFTTEVFIQAESEFANESTIIMGSVHLAANFVSLMLVDRLGRKALLLISNIVMSLTIASLGAYFFIQSKDPETARGLTWLPLTSLCFYIIAYALGMGPVPWVVMSEVYSKEIKAITGPVIACFNWTMAFIITVTFLSISGTIGIGPTFWAYATCSAIGAVFVLSIVPETKGKSLAEIQRMLEGEKDTEAFNKS